MQLLVIRHARAQSVKEYAKTGQSDDLRPLTDEGRERMRSVAAGLHRLVSDLDVLATSPLVRTRQTAEIVAAEFGLTAFAELDALRPESEPGAFVEWAREAGARETIAVVGHDAHLRALVGCVLTGHPVSIVKIRKGGAVMLEVDAGGGRWGGDGKLLWSLMPRHLRMLAG